MGWALATLILAGANPSAIAQAPYGLDSRAAIGPYLNGILPAKSGAFPFPLVLSATGAFSNLQTMTPAQGLIPFTVNSALWSDGAIKTRWMAIPNDGPPYNSAEQIGFAPTGEWSFPDGTVFVKTFELVVNENTGARKRLETRLLVRDGNHEVYGITYKWRADNSDADLLSEAGLDENVNVTTSSGAVRVQKWSYPSRQQCLFCHNAPASYVLGLKTHQQNGNFTYPATGRTDNQLRTFARLGLLNPAPSESEIAALPRANSIEDSHAPIEHRMRSWIDSNCSQCHRPNGFCPQFDARFSTPLKNQNLLGTYVKFRNPSGSEFYQRDSSLDPAFKMPPLAKNLIHDTAMEILRQWIASPLEVLSVSLYQDNSHLLVRFNSVLDVASATVAANYALDQGLAVSSITAGPSPDSVILGVSPLNPGQNYTLTLADVRDTAPSANTIWPQSKIPFVAQFEPQPATHRLANISTRQRVTDASSSIAGFIVRGSAPKRVLIRALGPALRMIGLAGALRNPRIELFDAAGALIASNDDWAANYNRQEIIDSGLAPLEPAESVILVRLPVAENGSAYTAVVRGAEGAAGICLLEVYDLDGGVGSSLLNESARGLVRGGDDVLIAGTIVVGSAPQKIVVRAIAPSLPIAGTLQNPMLELRDGNGVLLEANDDWVNSPNKQAIIDSSIPPMNNLESTIVRTLAPAAYTAIVRGVGDTTGIAVVEVYALN